MSFIRIKLSEDDKDILEENLKSQKVFADRKKV